MSGWEDTTKLRKLPEWNLIHIFLSIKGGKVSYLNVLPVEDVFHVSNCKKHLHSKGGKRPDCDCYLSFVFLFCSADVITCFFSLLLNHTCRAGPASESETFTDPRGNCWTPGEHTIVFLHFNLKDKIVPQAAGLQVTDGLIARKVLSQRKFKLQQYRWQYLLHCYNNYKNTKYTGLYTIHELYIKVLERKFRDQLYWSSVCCSIWEKLSSIAWNLVISFGLLLQNSAGGLSLKQIPLCLLIPQTPKQTQTSSIGLLNCTDDAYRVKFLLKVF